MSGAAVWPQTVTAAALFAVDPAGTGGICVRAAAGPVRDRWLEVLRRFLPPSAGLRKLSPGISDGRLLGGIDLAATLQAGRPVVERGLLAEIDGGVLLAPMAERLSLSTAAHILCCAGFARDRRRTRRVTLRLASSFGVVAFDEGIDDESGPASLCDRLAFQLDLDGLSHAQATEAFYDPDDIAAARDRLRHVTVPADAVAALCSVAASLGIASLRAPLLAVRVARAAAALDGLDAVARAHVEVAARLVLAPRATIMPAPPEDVPEPPQQHEPSEAERDAAEDKPLDDLVLEAAQAAIPPDLLKRLQDTMAGRQRNASAGKQGQSRMGPRRGRPVGVRRGDLRAGARLNILETLRAAAPWQPLRRRAGGLGNNDKRVLIRKDDFRITRFKQRSATSTIFVVDASGSSALQRLAEVKGAIELLLADCYVRRDEVALIAFRGRTAELILPPTRSLTRAKRSLAALPGGGGTPLSPPSCPRPRSRWRSAAKVNRPPSS